MPTSDKKKPKNTKRSIWPKLITFTLLLLFAAVAISLLPRSFQQDTSIIGKGTNVVVLMLDPVLVQGTETVIAMNEVRDEYEGRLEFIISNINTPEGRLFYRTHDLRSNALVFFAANGERLEIVYAPQVAESLRNNVNRIFKY